MKIIHNEDNNQNPVFAALHVKKQNTQYRSNHSPMAKLKAYQLFSLAVQAYTRSRVFINYRKNFIAVKIMNVDKRDFFNIKPHQALEQFVNDNNIACITTGKQSVIYRI